MNITPIIPDGYNGPIKQLTCRICKHLFYITQDDYRRLQKVHYCHECSLILLEELQNNREAAALHPPTVPKAEPVLSVPSGLSLQSSPPVRLPAPRTLDREKMTVEQVLAEAQMFEKTWRYCEALRSYEEALQRDPHCIEALYGRASMLSILHRPREALVVYEELLRLEPASAQTLSRKGWTTGSLKRYEEAFATFDAALQLDPSDQEASSGKWFFLTHLDRGEEAKLLRQSKMERAPRHEDVTGPCSTADDYYQRGLALSAVDRDEEAIRAYEECLRLDPLHLDVYERIHFIHLAKGRHEQRFRARRSRNVVRSGAAQFFQHHPVREPDPLRRLRCQPARFSAGVAAGHDDDRFLPLEHRRRRNLDRRLPGGPPGYGLRLCADRGRAARPL